MLHSRAKSPIDSLSLLEHSLPRVKSSRSVFRVFPDVPETPTILTLVGMTMDHYHGIYKSIAQQTVLCFAVYNNIMEDTKISM